MPATHSHENPRGERARHAAVSCLAYGEGSEAWRTREGPREGGPRAVLARSRGEGVDNDIGADRSNLEEGSSIEECWLGDGVRQSHCNSVRNCPPEVNLSVLAKGALNPEKKKQSLQADERAHECKGMAAATAACDAEVAACTLDGGAADVCWLGEGLDSLDTDNHVNRCPVLARGRGALPVVRVSCYGPCVTRRGRTAARAADGSAGEGAVKARVPRQPRTAQTAAARSRTAIKEGGDEYPTAPAQRTVLLLTRTAAAAAFEYGVHRAVRCDLVCLEVAKGGIGASN
ncbi:hypothetical protein K438DRAFT_1783968 [Mycena galopus ATCC 62051]|nr:hypothetical protein K438DRAFT_1783968 [Mycena galopus ATCC 62051]